MRRVDYCLRAFVLECVVPELLVEQRKSAQTNVLAHVETSENTSLLLSHTHGSAFRLNEGGFLRFGEGRLLLNTCSQREHVLVAGVST